MSSSVAGALLGLFVGMRHAFEPDHLTAVATLASEARGPRRGAVLGALWGVGHTVSIVLVGMILLVVGGVMPSRLAASFEIAVSAMLVVLGVRAIVLAVRVGAAGPACEHRHGHASHRHAGPAAHFHVGRWALAWRPLAVGLVHGLAGSGALTALVFARLGSSVDRVVYLALFGAGSIAGMAVASAVVGASFARFARSGRTLGTVAGLVSIVLGVVWSLPLWSQLS